jgi:hypothetical protein
MLSATVAFLGCMSVLKTWAHTRLYGHALAGIPFYHLYNAFISILNRGDANLNKEFR